MKNAILIDKIEAIDATEAMILRYLLTVFQYSADGGKHIDYARSSKRLGITYSRFSNAIKRLKQKRVLIQIGEKLYLGKMIVEAVVEK